MRVHDAIRKMLAGTGNSARGVSAAIGRGPTFLSATFTHARSMQTNTLAAVAAACGYELVLRPREGDDGEAFVIDE